VFGVLCVSVCVVFSLFFGNGGVLLFLNLSSSCVSLPFLVHALARFLSSISLQAGPQPKTKEELMKWIKEFCNGVKNHGEPNTWDVTLVTDMSKLFRQMVGFNAPIDQWNTKEVTNMSDMFQNAISFNQPITMDTSQVTNMSGMFGGASSFNQPITMDTSKVTEMFEMFHGAKAMTHVVNNPINK